jgi:hypothetical protein
MEASVLKLRPVEYIFMSWILLVSLAVGCPGPPPPPVAIPIVHMGLNGQPVEADGEWQVHTVRVGPSQTSESRGTPVQQALVAWIGSWQNLEPVSFVLTSDANAPYCDMVILARKRR